MIEYTKHEPYEEGYDQGYKDSTSESEFFTTFLIGIIAISLLLNLVGGIVIFALLFF